ncbi:MAG: 2-dehydropantoate 2-reductase [Coraliomargarita sp.]
MIHPEERTWALVGPGAIGLYYGGLLARNGTQLHVVGRSDFAALAGKGIRIRMMNPQTDELDAEYQVRPTQLARNPAAIGPMNFVIIAAKSTANPALLDTLRPLVRRHTVILSLQNGMGNTEFFAQAFPGNPVLTGLCFVCVNRTEPGLVENYLPGRVEIGSLEDRYPRQVKEVVEALVAAGIKCRASESLNRALWRKLCWNVPFNGLAIAAGGITTDKIVADPELKRRARALMEEVRLAAAAEAVEIPEDFLQGQFDVTEKMGAYQPSSLIDFLAGRPVEVDSIWGEPLRRGQARSVPMPELERLHAEIAAAVS